MEIILVMLVAFSIMDSDIDNNKKSRMPDCSIKENQELCLKIYTYESNIDYQNRMNAANAFYNLGSVISNSSNVQNARFQTTCKTKKDPWGNVITDCN